jgi:hypothetical protein
MIVTRPRPMRAYRAAEKTTKAAPHHPIAERRPDKEGINQNEQQFRNQQNGIVIQLNLLGRGCGFGCCCSGAPTSLPSNQSR